MELTSGEVPIDFILSRAEDPMRDSTELVYLNGRCPALSIPEDLCWNLLLFRTTVRLKSPLAPPRTLESHST